MNKTTKALLIAVSIALFASGCATDEFGNPRSLTRAEKGAIIGATTGALIGLKSKDKKKAVLYGLVGGIAGGAVGSYMDKQRKDLEAKLADEIRRGDIELQKLPDHTLKVTMTASTAFEVNSSTIKPGFKSTMNKVAWVVNKYGKTHLTLVGHTDSTGSRAYNQQLSEKRANSIRNYLGNKKVIPQRMSTFGAGEDEPRADNSTSAGKQLNRRVEMFIEPVVEKS